MTALQDKGLKNIGKSLPPEPGMPLAGAAEWPPLPQRITACVARH
jgi:hypothetical protein